MIQSSVRIEDHRSNKKYTPVIDLQPLPVKVIKETSLNEVFTLLGQNRQTYSGLTCSIFPVNTAFPPSLRSLRQLLLELNHVVVVDNGKPIGILTKRDLVHLVAKEQVVKHHAVETVMMPFPVIVTQRQAADIGYVATLFQQHPIGHLPVVDTQGDLVKVLPREKVFEKLHPTDLLRLNAVSEAMIQNVVQAEPTTTLQTIAQLLDQYQVSSIVISETLTGKTHPIGIITAGDIVQFQSLHLNFKALTAQAVMSQPLFCTLPSTNLWQAFDLMSRHRISHLVVTHEDNSLAGILTPKTFFSLINPTAMFDMISRLQRRVISLETETVHLLDAHNGPLIKSSDYKVSNLEQQLHFNHLLAKINRRVRASLDLDQVFSAAVQSLQELLHVDRVMVYRFNADGSGRVTVESVSDARWSLLHEDFFDPCFQHESVERFLREPVRAIANIRDANLQLCHVEFLETLGVKSSLAAAIRNKDQLWGLLLLHHCQEIRYWTDREVELLHEVGVQLAIAFREACIHQLLQTEPQARLATEQQLLKHLACIEEAGDGIAIVENDHYQYVNLAHAEMFGYEAPDELVGKSWKHLYDLKNNERLEQEIFSSLRQYRTWHGEANAIRKDGSTFSAGLSLTLTEDNLLICVCQDISDRKTTEAELQTLSTRLGLALKSGAIGTWEWDLTTHQLTWDRRMCELYGIKPEAFSGLLSEWANCLHPEDFADVHAQMQQAIAEHKELNIEFRIIQPDGKLRYIQANGLVQSNADGCPQRMIGINFDISDRKQVEADMVKALNKEKELSEMKSRFVSNTSHEFRTPLAVISSNAELLKMFGDKLSKEETQECLDTILSYVEHTTELINEVLVVNKAEAGSIALNVKSIDVVEFSQKLCKEIGTSVPNHLFEFGVQDDRPQSQQQSTIAQLDTKLLQQILTNLLTNASKYSPESSQVTFQINLLSHEIEFSVADKGIGIPEEDQKHLFSPFHRANNVGAIPGTGLGLSIVKHLVSVHQGRIKVQSVPNEGSCFTVNIPTKWGA